MNKELAYISVAIVVPDQDEETVNQVRELGKQLQDLIEDHTIFNAELHAMYDDGNIEVLLTTKQGDPL